MNQAARIISIGLIAAMSFMSGCAGIGPDTIARDRFDYTFAISDSWKSQMLLNIVKMRYGDAPIFLDVASVINQYSVEQEFGAGVGSEIYNRGEPSFIGPGVRAGGRYTDRPTITYSPIIGEKFAKSLMTPLPLYAILNLVQSGYPIDMVFRFAVHSINGIQNRFGGLARVHSADPEFYHLLEKLKNIQSSKAIGMQIKKLKDKEASVVILKGKVSPKTQEESQEVRKILGLEPQETEFEVVYNLVSRSDKEIAIITRSMLEILMDLGSLIEVPESHVATKRVNPTFKDEGVGRASVPPLMRVYSSPEKPADVFVSVRYRDHWFFIDDRDLPSKGVFSFLMFAFTLTETGRSREGAPIVTIPTNHGCT